MKYNIKDALLLISRRFSNQHAHRTWKILFFGTDKFSLYSLKALNNEYRNGTLLKNLEVVTTTKGNPIQKFAVENGLNLLAWPPSKLDNGAFHIGVVVSFGHLIPENIISKFPYGMINVHASLLPRWRGAAPIIYTLANGDVDAGVTIMKIKPKVFDIGEIIMQETVKVPEDMRMPELHETLGVLGAKCLLKTIREFPDILEKAKPQPKEGVTFAPKVNNEFATVKWDSMTSRQIYNLDRAVAGFLTPTTTWNGTTVKLFEITECDSPLHIKKDTKPQQPGYIHYDKKTKSLYILCLNSTWISVKKIGVYGKKIMTANDFINGYVKKEPPDKWYFK